MIDIPPFYTIYGLATAALAGLVSTTTQSFAGVKTFVDGLKVGSAGTTLTKIDRYSTNITPSSVGANTTAEQTFAVVGLAVGDVVFVSPPASMPTGLGMGAPRVSAADTLALTFINNTAGALTPISGAYLTVAVRS